MNRRFLLCAGMSIISLGAMQKEFFTESTDERKRIAVIAQAWKDMKYTHAVHRFPTSCETGGKAQVRDVMFNESSDVVSMKRQCAKDANVLLPVMMRCGRGSLVELPSHTSFNQRKGKDIWDMCIGECDGKNFKLYDHQRKLQGLINIPDICGGKFSWARNWCLVAFNKHFCVMGVNKHGDKGVMQHLYVFKVTCESEKDKSFYQKGPVLEFLVDLGLFENADCADISDDGHGIVMAESDGTLHYFHLKALDTSN